MYEQGDLVLVPFPFTNLTARKKRPAVVVSPDWFNSNFSDVVLVAVTSAVPQKLNPYLEISLTSSDLLSGNLPSTSIIKICKIFTCEQTIIIKKIAKLKESKTKEILSKLQLFLSQSS